MARITYTFDPEHGDIVSLIMNPDEAASIAACLDSGSSGFGSESGLWATNDAINTILDRRTKLFPNSTDLRDNPMTLTSNCEIDSDRYDFDGVNQEIAELDHDGDLEAAELAGDLIDEVLYN